jgi:SNF2 family DNA or RNA helicase
MANTRWEIDGNILIVRYGNGRIVIPSSDAIYSMVFEKEVMSKLPDMDKASSAAVKKLSFSRYPIDVRIVIKGDKDNSGGLSCQIVAMDDDIAVPINDIASRKADHIVHLGKWYPLPPGRKEDVIVILDKTGINKPGPISLRQFLQLRKLLDAHPIIYDQVGLTASAQSISQRHEVSSFGRFKGKLYSYQKNGLEWLHFLCREGLGGILADEMGLGKTIQVIALLASEQSKQVFPALIIAPTTLLPNWGRELAKFAPDLRVLIHRGSQRTGFPSALKKYDVIISSYDTVVRDLPIFRQIHWKVVVADEAQAIKNPQANRTRELKKLPRAFSLAMTGTPVENSLSDLWSISDFSVPDLLGDIAEFRDKYRDDHMGASNLEPIISPLMLRRKVAQVASDLPPRIEIPQTVEMSAGEANQYEKIRQEIVSQYGSKAGLVSLIKLRQFCTHPSLLLGSSGDPAQRSEKYHRLTEVLEEIFLNGQKVLIFTSFNDMIDLLMQDLPMRFGGIYCQYIDGRISSQQRQSIVDDFTSFMGAGILALNPKAGGTGLNITAANHVIHYNLEWNPAVEDQASARAYRRGQKLPVTIHRLYYENTVEEIVNDRLDRKRSLADVAVVGTAGGGSGQDYRDIIKALSISPVSQGGSNDK